MTGLINDSVASAEEVSLAREQSDKKLQQALSELEKISHEGAYKQWLTTYQVTFNDLKGKDPLSYQRFLEKFTAVKQWLSTKGVLHAR
jgi:hypothetical protein